MHGYTGNVIQPPTLKFYKMHATETKVKHQGKEIIHLIGHLRLASLKM